MKIVEKSLWLVGLLAYSAPAGAQAKNPDTYTYLTIHDVDSLDPAWPYDAGKPKPNAYKDAAKAVQVEGDNVVFHLPKPYAPLLTIFASWAQTMSKQWSIKNGDWDGTEATWIKYNNPKKESSPYFERAN